MKFGIREAVDVVFKVANADGMTFGGVSLAQYDPVLYFDTLKMATTEGTATTVYAQGGAGNPRLIAWEGDKTITFTFEDALISPEGMAILTGAGIVDASTTTLRAHRKSVATLAAGAIAANGIVTITPGTTTGVDALESGETISSTGIYAFKLDSAGEIDTRIPATSGGLGLGFVSSGAAFYIGSNGYLSSGVASKVLLDYYVAKTSGAKEISITPDQFAGYFYIEGETLFRRQSDGADLPAQIIIPNAKIQTAFTFSMSPTGDPSTFTFTADAFPGTVQGGTTSDKVLYAIQLFED